MTDVYSAESFTGVVLLSVTLACLPAAELAAAPGDLDPSFGAAGIVTTNFLPGVVQGLVVEPSGRIVAAGSDSSALVLARYLPDGTLDATFGSGGTVHTELGSGIDAAYDLIRQPDGKLVVAGLTQFVGEFSIIDAVALARYDANGALDPTFGTGGIVRAGGVQPYAIDLLLQADGRLVVALAGGFRLARFSASGGLDPSFGTGGIVTTALGSLAAEVFAVAQQPDGKLVAAGRSIPAAGSGSIVLARYDLAGNLDPTFGIGGVRLTDVSPSLDQAYAVTLQPDGFIVSAGSAPTGTFQAPRDFVVLRHDPNGSADGAFGAGGVVRTDFGFDEEAFAVLVEPDGRIVAAGHLAGLGRVDLARYESDGSPDVSFGSGGRVSTVISSGAAFRLARQLDGRLVIGGESYNGNNAVFMLARYLGSDCGNGVVDPGEACEPGLSGPTCCTTSCTLAASGTTCRAATDACDPAEVCNGVSPACPTDTGSSGAGTNGRLDLGHLRAPSGDESLALSVDRHFAPAPAIDPLANGVRLVVSDALAQPVVDVTIPGGTGWTAKGAPAAAWTYRSLSPAPLGITRMSVRLVRKTPGLVRVKARGRSAYPVVLTALPLRGRVLLEVDPMKCLEASFPATRPGTPSCEVRGGGATVRCR